MPPARVLLIDLLQKAYSGELAAALAYNGHSKSVKSEVESAQIRKIEEDELRHRNLVGSILQSLGEGPDASREFRMAWIGRTIGALCHVSGWFFPMYGAGKLERRNIVEYENAARHARDAGLTGLIECLLEMAEVEWDHELYFREKASTHFLWKILPGWNPPPARERIRADFFSGKGT